MNIILESNISQIVINSLGWTLFHFVWQACLVALVVAFVFAVTRRRSAQLRYLIACVGMLVMVLLPVGTFVVLLTNSDWIGDRLSSGEPVSLSMTSDSMLGTESATNQAEPNEAGFTAGSSVLAGDSTGGRNGNDSSIGSYIAMIQTCLPWLVAIWATIVLLLATRMSFGLKRVFLWRKHAVEITDQELKKLFSRLTKQMRMFRKIRFLATERVSAPAVIGWLHPAILVPGSMISGLTVSELESILAHELAHIRRHDYVINLAQSFAETILFYHPAVWWLSNRIRLEREHCCDDIAIAVTGNRVALVKALTHMEEIRCRPDRIALASNGGSLVDRIRRLATSEPAPAEVWWPAGLLSLATFAFLLLGLFTSEAIANPKSEKAGTTASMVTEPAAMDEEQDYPTKKLETVKTDSKTGVKKRVFGDIKLSTKTSGKLKNAKVDMMYSNVMPYTFIPARIAKELGAVELGELDFGEKAPPQARRMQKMYDPLKDAPKKNDPAQIAKTITVDELTAPVAAGVRIVPYKGQAIWVPAHLGFYGMNQTKQHQFKIVRLQNVDVGIGPSFGPVNALVLDDENSDFGVLGRNWTKRVRGRKGETLWHLAADGSFRLLARKNRKANSKPNPDEPTKPEDKAQQPEAKKIRMQRTGNDKQTVIDPRSSRPNVKVFSSHAYNPSRRESTDWIEVNGAKLPVDVGVQHEGITVYLSLMNDVFAVDEDRNVVWNIPWGKTQPFWRTLSIVELEFDGERQPAVELFAADTKSGDLKFRYVLLESGASVETPIFVPVAKQKSERGNHKLPLIKVAERNGELVTRAFANAIPGGRGPADLVKHFSTHMDLDDPQVRESYITNMESIVSALPNYLLHNAMDADEVLFNLPEGSSTRAVFKGKQVDIRNLGRAVEVVVTHGKIELLDPMGVVRATASPDGGAEQIVAICEMKNREVVLSLRTRRIANDEKYPKPPVQVVMNLKTGAPEDEKDPPHGSIRYSIHPENKSENKPARMKMKWRYQIQRLIEASKQIQN